MTTLLFAPHGAFSFHGQLPFSAAVATPAAGRQMTRKTYVEKIGKDVLRLANAGSRGKATRATSLPTLLSKYVNLYVALPWRHWAPIRSSCHLVTRRS
jgi:hypothetical protein